MAKHSPRLRLSLIAVTTALILAAAYTAWWFILAQRLQDGLYRWVNAQNAAGLMTVATGTVAAAGFPGDIHLVLSRPSLAYSADLRWDGPPLTATVSPFTPNHPRLSAPGQHLISFAGRPAVPVTADTATAELVLDGHGVEHGAFEATDMASGDTRLGRLSASWRRLSDATGDTETAGLGVSASLQQLVLAQQPQLVFGRTVSSAAFEADIKGRLPQTALKSALAAWRDAGGVIELKALAMTWPPLSLSGNGTFALDRDMQPLFASTCTIRGLFEVIDSLTAAGTVRAKDAGVAKLVLGLLAKSGVDGVREWTVPVSLQDHVLYVGPAALMRVPELVW
jgi:hypothetical protein